MRLALSMWRRCVVVAVGFALSTLSRQRVHLVVVLRLHGNKHRGWQGLCRMPRREHDHRQSCPWN